MTFTSVFRAPLFLIEKAGNKPNLHHLLGKQMMGVVQTKEYCSAVQRNRLDSTNNHTVDSHKHCFGERCQTHKEIHAPSLHL